MIYENVTFEAQFKIFFHFIKSFYQMSKLWRHNKY